MPDMTVTVNGTEQLAERACRMVFGTNADAGPVRPAPAVLLDILAHWPGRGDQVHDVALHLPVDFDISAEIGRGNVKAVVLRVCRITVLREGRKVGYALRTDEAGLQAIDVYERTWAVWNPRLRQAH